MPLCSTRITRWFVLAAIGLFIAAPAPAQNPEPDLFSAGTTSGVSAYRPGRWSVLRSAVENPSEQSVEVLLTHSFTTQPQVQFATRLRLPPMSRRWVDQLVRLPENIKGKQAGLQLLLIDPSASAERVFADGRQESSMRVDGEGPVTGLLGDPDDDDEAAMANLVRRSVGSRPRNPLLTPGAFPSDPAGYEPLDGLFLTADHNPLDPAQTAALRSWLIAGGRLWVMLDQVDPAFLTALLRDDAPVELIDRVPLSTVTFEGFPESRRDFDPPVTMARLLPGSARVLHKVNGWPAALRWNIGEGFVIATTLSPRAWQDARRKTVEPLQMLAADFLRAPAVYRPVSADFEPLARGQVGYSIVGRTTVLAMMLLFIAMLVLPGIVLTQRRRGEWTALLGACAALIVVAVFILIGAVTRRQAPTTLAWATLAHVTPSQDAASLTGLVSVYAPEAGLGPVESHGQGIAWPTQTDAQGSLRRLTWTDHEQWEWQPLELPSGAVRLFDVRTVVPISADLTARATFDESGLVGVMPPSGGRAWEEPAIVTARSVMPISPRPDGRFTLTAEPTAPVTTGASSTPLTRRAAIQRLVSHRFTQPTLIGWAEPIASGLALPQESVQRGGCIMAVPLRIDPPRPGARIRIPSELLAIQSVRSPVGDPVAPVYNQMTGTWDGAFNASLRATIRFTLPPAVASLRLESAAVRLDIRAPRRRVELITYDNARARPLEQWESPGGEARVLLEGDRLPPVTPEGFIYLTVQVHDPRERGTTDEDSSEIPWSIRGMSLELLGVTGPADRQP
ncbi:MAG: hypothetical protein K8S99_15330 [Planctomycetes bacterium]|nr:hypothetical protein [Planctomycetota bacterium]